MLSLRKKLSLLLSALLLIAALPAGAVTIDTWLADFETETPAIPDLSVPFGSEGVVQSEIFSVDLITGKGILYDDGGSGCIAADLVLLQQGFSAAEHIVSGHMATLYEKGSIRILMLPQILPGKTLVITAADEKKSPSLAAPLPSERNTADDAGQASITLHGKSFTLPLKETILSDIYTEVSFSNGEHRLILGLPTQAQTGDVISPEYVLTQSECYPYITYIDPDGIEWYALAWNEPLFIRSDLSIEYAVKMEPGSLADYMITFRTVSSALCEGDLTACLARTDLPTDTMELSGSFRFEFDPFE